MSAPLSKPDPRRPWKTLAGMLSAFLTAWLAAGAGDLPSWAIALVTGLVAALAVYLVPNPKEA